MAGRKRGATSELNHDNWDQEAEPEEKGTMVVAATETLESRNIIRAKRKLTTTTPTQSPFAGLSLFGSRPMSASSLVSSGFSFSASPQPSFQSPVISSFNNSDSSPSFANTGLFSSMLAPSKFSSNNGVQKDETVAKKDEGSNNLTLRDNSTTEVTTSNVSAAAASASSETVDETSNSKDQKDEGSQGSKSDQNSSTYREAHNDSLGNVSNDDNEDDFDVEDDEVEKDSSEVAEPYADSDSSHSSSEDVSHRAAAQAEPVVDVDNDPPLPPDDDDW